MKSNSLFQTLLVRPIVIVFSMIKNALFILVLLASLAFNFIAFSSSGLALALAKAVEPIAGTIKSNSVLKQENDRLKTTLKSKSQQLKRASASLSRAAADIRYRDGQIIGKSLAFTKAEASLKRLQAKLVKVGPTFATMRSRIVRSASANVGSVVGEAIPFWGAAVVVTTTGYELKTLCALMKDINQLEAELAVSVVADDDASRLCGFPLPTADKIKHSIMNSPRAGWVAVEEYFLGPPEQISGANP